MAEVSIPINGVNYKITCDDGQEERLLELARYFDGHVQSLSDQIGNVADSRLMLLAGLTVCDDLLETKQRLRDMELNTGTINEDGAAEIIATAAKKVREVTGRLDQAS